MSGLWLGESAGVMVIDDHAISLDESLSGEDRAWLAEWVLREADEVIGKAHVKAGSLRRLAEKLR